MRINVGARSHCEAESLNCQSLLQYYSILRTLLTFPSLTGCTKVPSTHQRTHQRKVPWLHTLNPDSRCGGPWGPCGPWGLRGQRGIWGCCVVQCLPIDRAWGIQGPISSVSRTWGAGWNPSTGVMHIEEMNQITVNCYLLLVKSTAAGRFQCHHHILKTVGWFEDNLTIFPFPEPCQIINCQSLSY